MSRSVLVVAKLAATALGLVAIAGGLTMLGGPATPVDEADALIVDQRASSTDDQQRFVEVLDAYDMSEPKAYDYNGHTVYMSRGASHQSPKRILHDMQRRFAHRGLNEYVHRTVSSSGAPANDRTLRRDFRTGEDFLTGGLVPTTIGPTHVAMTGVETEYDADNLREMTRRIVRQNGRLGPEAIERFRYVEAFRARESDRTRLLAYWSDDRFDFESFRTDRRSQASSSSTSPAASMETSLPRCPDCRRLTSLKGLGESGRRTVLFETSAPPSRIEAFYQRTLRNRGWRASSALESVDRLGQRYGLGSRRLDHARYAAFRRGSQLATLLVYRTSDDRTRVKWMVSR